MSFFSAAVRRWAGEVHRRAFLSHSLACGVPASAHSRCSINSCSRRCFWNPFSPREGSGDDKKPALSPNTVQHQRIVEKAHRDASLHNERLLDACLDLLDICGVNSSSRSGGLDEAAAATISAVVETTMHDFRKTPAEQFDLIYAALCLPSAATNRHLQRCLMVLLEAFLPEALFRVFESADLVVVVAGPDDAARRDALCRLVHALLGCAEVPDGVESEEVVLVYLDDVRAAFPGLRANAAFTALEANATSIAMRARLYALLSRLCAEFDQANTGRVDLDELRVTVQRVLGPEQACLLLDGAQPDKDGKIRYTQLTSLLTRPPPRQR